MTKTIIAEDISEGVMLVIRVRTDLDDHALANAIRAAARGFAASPDSANAMSATAGHFNWGDLSLWLPEKYQKEHGFLIEDASVADFVVPHDQSLLEPARPDDEDQ